MNLLQEYVDSMNAWDAPRIAAVFCEDGTFNDVAAKLLTGTPGFFEGRPTIQAVFEKMFAAKPKATILKMDADGKRMDYNIEIMGKVLECTGTLEEEQDGLMKYYSCKPRGEA